VEDRIAAGFCKNSARWALSRCTGCIEEELHCEFKKKTESLRELWGNSARRALSQCADRAQKERTLLSSGIEEESKEGSSQGC
jgi:hypothetical protein